MENFETAFFLHRFVCKGQDEARQRIGTMIRHYDKNDNLATLYTLYMLSAKVFGDKTTRVK